MVVEGELGPGATQEVHQCGLGCLEIPGQCRRHSTASTSSPCGTPLAPTPHLGTRKVLVPQPCLPFCFTNMRSRAGSNVEELDAADLVRRQPGEAAAKAVADALSAVGAVDPSAPVAPPLAMQLLD